MKFGKIIVFFYNREPGVYITSEEAIDQSLEVDALWQSNPEKSIGLVVVRAMIFNKGLGTIGQDLSRIHGAK